MWASETNKTQCYNSSNKEHDDVRSVPDETPDKLLDKNMFYNSTLYDLHSVRNLQALLIIWAVFLLQCSW